MKFNDYHVGMEIRRLLGESGLSQKQFARRIGVQLSVLKYYFTRRELSLPVLRRLSVALNTDLILPFISSESLARLERAGIAGGETKDKMEANAALSRKPHAEVETLALEVKAMREELASQNALVEELRGLIAKISERD